MGLVEISDKMTSSVTIPTTSSRSPASSTNSSTTPTSSTSPDQVVRKKRTFDIAFLTGQSENEGGGDNLERASNSNSTGLCSTSSNNNNDERKCAVSIINAEEHHNHHHHHHHHHSGVSRYSNPKEEDGTNSDSSSIDVMTNGSLSEESQQHSPSSSIPERSSPPFHSMLLIHHQQQQLSRANGPSLPYSSSNGSTSSGISHRSSSHNSSYDHHHHHHHHNLHRGDIKSNRSSSPPRVASTGNKTRNNRSPVKEEIRFESRRIIDINQTVDSLKIKENLQFSTLLPSSAASLGLNLSSSGGNNGGGVSERADLTLPHLASTIALLPHVARFPLGLPSLTSGVMAGSNHMPKNIPFHAKMEKSESINISYPKLRGGAFPDPYAVLAASASTCGYPYPNIGIPPELGRHPPFPNPLGSPGGASPGDGNNTARRMHSPGSGGGQQVSSQPPHSQQAPPPPAPSTTSVPPCGMSPSATLLPPSLTSLTLPAQNVCAKCNIGFRMTSDLVYHMRSHHKRDTDPMKKQREEKLKCPVCHETFRERHHLTRHMTAHQDRAEEA